MSTNNLVDFQVPPAEPGWYGVICDTGTGTSAVAVYWTGSEWIDQPILPMVRSEARFQNTAGARAWLEKRGQRS